MLSSNLSLLLSRTCEKSHISVWSFAGLPVLSNESGFFSREKLGKTSRAKEVVKTDLFQPYSMHSIVRPQTFIFSCELFFFDSASDGRASTERDCARALPHPPPPPPPSCHHHLVMIGKDHKTTTIPCHVTQCVGVCRLRIISTSKRKQNQSHLTFAVL